MERVKGQKILFGRMVEDEKSFLCLVDSEVAPMPGFLPGQVLAAEDLFRDWIGEALNHRQALYPKKRTQRGFSRNTSAISIGLCQFETPEIPGLSDQAPSQISNFKFSSPAAGSGLL
jgi:hypothetical protein